LLIRLLRYEPTVTTHDHGGVGAHRWWTWASWTSAR
jgi:hypothetical protein